MLQYNQDLFSNKVYSDFYSYLNSYDDNPGGVCFLLNCEYTCQSQLWSKKQEK